MSRKMSLESLQAQHQLIGKHLVAGIDQLSQITMLSGFPSAVMARGHLPAALTGFQVPVQC